MNDDERTPPPIPPYRPERAGQGPEDAVTPVPEPAPAPASAADRDRERALERLEAKSEFRTHLTVYLLVMMLLSGIWAVTNFGGFYWPIFPMMGWGLGVAIHGMSLAWDREPSEDEIDAEIERLHRRRSRGRLEE